MHLVLFAMYRKEGTSHEDFVAHYRDVHIPITSRFPGVRRYEVFPASGEDGPDAFALMGFDSAEDFQAVFSTPEGAEAMADSETFVSRTEVHVVDHIPVVEPSVRV